jgi:MFS family permease
MSEFSRFAVALVLMCFVFGLISRGLHDSFSVFVPAIEGELGWSRAEVASIYACGMIGIGFGGPIVGWLFDRFGPRRLALAGLLACALATAIASRSERLWQFQASLGLLYGVGVVALGAVLQTAILSRWFRRRLTTAIAIGYSANGLGMLIFAPLAQTLIGEGGFRFAYAAFAALVALVALPVAFLPWRRIAAGHPDIVAPTDGRSRSPLGPTLAEAMQTFPFWGLTWAFCLTSVGIYALTPQVVALLTEAGFAPLEAASLFGLSGLLMPIGMIAVGYLADRVGQRLALTLAYGATVGGVLALALVESPADMIFVILFALLFGLSTGTRGPVIARLAMRYFEGAYQGRIYGSITIGMGAGGAIGAVLGGAIRDWTGGYAGVLALSVAALALGALPFARLTN